MGVSLLVFFKLAGVGNGMTRVILAHVTFCVPFVMVAVRARLAGLDPSLEEAAIDLGATPLKAFLLVIVPYLMPAIIAGALLSFTLSMDEFVVTWFTYDAASRTLPVRVYEVVTKFGLKPELNAASAVFIVVTVVLIVIAESIQARSRREAGTMPGRINEEKA
jgi:spermidine/putrescine transport system permease protein